MAQRQEMTRTWVTSCRIDIVMFFWGVRGVLDCDRRLLFGLFAITMGTLHVVWLYVLL